MESSIDLNPLDLFTANLNQLRSFLTQWSRESFPNNRKLINELLEKLNACKNDCCDENGRTKAADIAKQIDCLWEKEEQYWAQRSRVQWLSYGDKNTKFFHTTTVQRRQRNKVSRIRNSNGVWVEKDEEVASCFSSFFKDLFHTVGDRDFGKVLDHVDRVVSEEDNMELCRPITDI